MSDMNGGGKTPYREIVSILDRSWETKRAIQLVQLVLFLDIALIFAGLPGLIGWNSGSTPILHNLNFVLVTLASFTVYAAFLTPLISLIFGNLLLVTPGIFHLVSKPNTEAPREHIFIREYGREAFKRKDQHMIERYLSCREQERESRTNQRQTGDVIFGAAVLILINAFPWLITLDTSQTLLQKAMAMTDPYFLSFIGVFLALVFGKVITEAWFNFPLTYIEEPEIYYEKLKEQRAARQEGRLTDKLD